MNVIVNVMVHCRKTKTANILLPILAVLFVLGGAEGSRTLVQLCDKLCLLHAYFPINCREQTGWKPTLPNSVGTLISPLHRTLQQPASLFRCSGF